LARPLASYEADSLNVAQLAGDYVGRVLKREKIADLPVRRSENSTHEQS
jgi:hypothetical protein